ncbi:hypothetical protein [Asticcacaulis solisilvae]|uniref:hypothetical protein n=1 Tax=Asticcacaulis solisilvae TaxID=1217274 RepID=UPI003FD894A5
MTPIWKTLGIARTGDRSAIRRAYAARLKETNPEDDPEGFKALREAYETALHQAGRQARPTEVTVVRREDVVAERQAEPGLSAEEELSTLVPDADMLKIAESLKAMGRTHAPVESDNALQMAREHLETLLRRDSESDDQARLEALQRLLQLPDLERIDIRNATEAWLLHLLCARIPRSDPLIGIARRYFDWNDDTIEHRRRGDDAALKNRLIEREKDLAFLRRISQPGSEHYRAFHVLSRPPKQDTWRTRLLPEAKLSEVRALLVRINVNRPQVENELNPQTVALWEARLARPGLAGIHLWMAILAAPCLAVLILAFWFADKVPSDLSQSAGPLLVLAASVPVVWTVVRSVAILAYIWPRKAWKRYADARPIPLFGFIGAGGVVILFALSTLPPSPILGTLVIALALVTIWWSLVTEELEESGGNWTWHVRLVFAGGAALLWWLVGLRSPMDGETKTMLSIAFIAGALFVGCGRRRALRAWSSLKAKGRAAVFMGLIAACAAGSAGLWLSTDSVSPAAFCIVALALLFHQWTFPFGKAWPMSAIGRTGFYVVAVVFLKWSSDDAGVAIAATALTVWLGSTWLVRSGRAA